MTWLLVAGVLVLVLIGAYAANERRWDARIRRFRRRQAKAEVRAAARTRRWW